MNWIEKQKELGILEPEIPSYLRGILRDAKQRKLTLGTELIIPSGQMWLNWSDTQKQEWRDMVESLNLNPEDFLHSMRQMLPATPRVKHG